jgi:tetratricopeptide (TPR) repeat protein
MVQRWAWLVVLVGMVACGGGTAKKPTTPVAATTQKPADAPKVDTARDPEVLEAHHLYQDALAAIDEDRAADAVEPLERALAVYEAKLAADDARLRDALQLMTQAYRGAERYKEAETTARRMLELVRKTGPRTSEVTALNQLGLGFYEAGETAEASRAWEAAAAVQQEIGLGLDNADVRVIHRNMALAYGDLDRHEDAIAVLRRVDAELELTDPNSLEAANTAYMLAGEYDGDETMQWRALELYTRAADIYAVQLDPDDERLMEALEWKGSLMWELRDLAGARDVYAQILKIHQRDGVRDLDLAGAYADLGVVETDLHNSAVAIIHLDQAIEMYKEAAEPDVEQIITLLAWRSRARVQHKDLAEADHDADEAIRMSVSLWGPAHERTLDMIESVASGYEDFKQAKKGKAFRARAKKLVKPVRTTGAAANR